MKIEFLEEQRFDQWWLWLLLGLLGLLMGYGFYNQIVLGFAFGSHPMPNWGLAIFSVSVFTMIGFFWCIRLRTEINGEWLRIRFTPLGKRSVRWADVKSAEVIDYGFVGYGYRLGTKYGTVYNTQGRSGLAVILKNGDKFLVGTQKEEELREVLQGIDL